MLIRAAKLVGTEADDGVIHGAKSARCLDVCGVYGSICEGITTIVSKTPWIACSVERITSRKHRPMTAVLSSRFKNGFGGAVYERWKASMAV